MKKIATFICMLLVTMMLVGCGASKETSASLSLSEDGVKNTILLEAKSDVVQTFTQTSEWDVSSYDDATKEQIKIAADDIQKQIGEIQSAQYSYELADSTLTETIVIDMTNAEDVKKLVDEGFLPIIGGGDEMNISLEQSVTELENSGWTLNTDTTTEGN